MKRFGDVLSSVAARLDVPEPAHSRILLELAADMEDLHLAYLQKGLSELEAQEAVVEQFQLSDEALRDLARVHDTTLQRSLDSLSGPVRSVSARLLLGLVALSVLVPSGRILVRAGTYGDAGPVVWLLLPLLLAGVILGIWKAHRLYLTTPERSRSLQKGLIGLLGLASLQVGLAVAGIWVELYRNALQIRRTPGQALRFLVEWLLQTSATLVVALSGALVLGFLWFFLQTRARHLEEAAVNRLLEMES
jgi:hypothetical protein